MHRPRSMNEKSSKHVDSFWRFTVIGAPYIWLILFFLAPILFVFKISLSDPIIGQPPFTSLLELTDNVVPSFQATLDNYRFLFEDDLYWVSYVNSLKVAGLSTVVCLLIGYPMAYAIARSKEGVRGLLLLLVILPFWTSFLLRVYAWMGMLSTHGVINNFLIAIGLTDQPVKLLYTDLAVYIGIVYTYLPFMILPLFANLERMDKTLNEAAADLGSRPFRNFVDITLPMSLPGIIAGSLLVFIPALGEFVIPAMLGGLDSMMIGRTLYDEFFQNRDWPLASAVASILLLILIIPIMIFQKYRGEQV